MDIDDDDDDIDVEIGEMVLSTLSITLRIDAQPNEITASIIFNRLNMCDSHGSFYACLIGVFNCSNSIWCAV